MGKQQSTIATILHLGLGSFHRAHQAVYLQALHDRGDQSWQLAGANIRPDMQSVITALHGQGGAYMLETVTPSQQRSYQRIESIRQVLPFEPGLASVIELGADPDTRIISFTVTEAGYYLDGSDKLLTDSRELNGDWQAAASNGMAGDANGATIYGALAAILRRRMQRDAGPVTLLCCDNLRHNGVRSRDGLMQFIERLNDPALLDFAQTQTSSPDCMVDRITPRPPGDLPQRVASQSDFDDAVPVMGEAFIQWVIQDNFVAGRPDWPSVGVEMVDDVAPYEEAKIRVLNASHAGIAWAGTLAGYNYIHEGVADQRIRQLAHDYVTEDVIPCLPDSPIDLAAYRDTVLSRFENAAIRDTNQRVAMDGFSKIPGFIAPTIRDALGGQRSVQASATLATLFLAFLQSWRSGQVSFEYEDQAMDLKAAHAICDADDSAAAFVGDQSLWGDLAGNEQLVGAVRLAQPRITQLIQATAL